MTSTIKLYSIPILQKGKNFVIEDFSSYLSGFTGYSFTSFQYIRPLKTITIKVSASQNDAEPIKRITTSVWNYLSVSLESAGTTNTYYYFIINKVQKAVSTIELTCEMDVLNTFQWNVHYTPTKRTLINREHKDRFSLHETQYKNIEIGSQATSIVEGNYYAFDLEDFFTNSPRVIGITSGAYLIYKKIPSMNGGTLVKEISTSGTSMINKELRMGTLLLGSTYIYFGIYNTLTMTYSDARYVLYQTDISDYYVFIKASQYNKTELETWLSYSRPLYDVTKFETTKYLFRNIDKVSEGINTPLFKHFEETIYDGSQATFVLYYANENQYDQNHPEDFSVDNPVNCYLTTKYGADIYVYNHFSVTPSDLSTGYAYLYYGLYNEFSFDGVNFNPIPNKSGPFQRVLEIQKSGTDFLVKLWEIEKLIINGVPNYRKRLLIDYGTTSTISFRFPSNYAISEEFSYYFTSSQASNIRLYERDMPLYHISWTISKSKYNTSVDNIDRTDTRGIKIIDLPYAPSPVLYDSVTQSYTLGSPWKYDAVLKLFKLDFVGEYILENTFESSYNPIDNCLIYEDITDFAVTDARNDNLESKLYHSDFFRPKFVYDSFNKEFIMELVDINTFVDYLGDYNGTFTIHFVVSKNITSKFLFEFPMYNTIYGVEDYDNVCCISRNNEEVLYTSQYLNYLRTGYNYDLKTKERNEIAGGVGLATSIVSTLGSVIGGIASQNYALAIVGGVMGSMSIAGASIGYAKSVADADQNIARKLEESQRQAVAVQNADDVDLLNVYTKGNKAKWCEYKVSNQMKDALLDMFYYSGYACIERKIPDISSRYWFNFLQCELDIKENTSKAYLTDELIMALKTAFKEGVTFFHHHTTWDLDQEKENYESWIFN